VPDPEVVVAMREFKRGLLAREDAQMREMASQWVLVEERLDAQIVALAAEFAQRREEGKAVTPAAMYRLERARRLQSQVRSEFTQYAAWSAGTLDRYQEQNAVLGIEHAVSAIQLSYPGGVGAYFDRLPVEAIRNVVGIAGDGKPLGDLLRLRMVRDKDGTELAGVWGRLTQSLVTGTALGRNPRKVARAMRDDLAGGLNKALVIARTEGMRPYREMSRSQYEKSGVVKGHKRLCGHDDSVCGACLADEGTLYSVREVIPDHPQGRCRGVPVVEGMPEVTWTGGEEWFLQQPVDVQRSILGAEKLAAWQDGRFEFRDLVQRTDDPVWGAGLNPRSLASLLRGDRDDSAPAINVSPVGPSDPRPVPGAERDLQVEIDEVRAMVDEMVANGDPTGGGLKGYLDSLEQGLKEEQQINAALWSYLGLSPNEATTDNWREVADLLDAEGYRLYKRYTRDGISLRVADKRGAQVSGYMVVGKEQVLVRRGAFSVRRARQMEGELWVNAKDDLAAAMGELLTRAGYSQADIAQADYAQRMRLLGELGSKQVARTPSGRVSKIDRVPQGARASVVDVVDFDLAAICENAALDPLTMPTLDAYGKMELAEMIRATKVGEPDDAGGFGELNF